jgi:tagatose 6-phosphate kinase
VILAAGLSPAWQQVLVVEHFQPGEVNRARRAYWCGSGKVLNVGVALHYLSGRSADHSLSLAPLGGPAYESIDAEFETLGVPRRWIRTEAPTRVCTTIVDAAMDSATELIENAGPITADELAEFERAYREQAAEASAVVLTGSLPAGVPNDFFARLLTQVNGRAVLDLRGPELLAALETRPTVVKPNRAELAATFGKPIATDDDLRQAMGELQRRGARSVVVTAGKDAVWLATEGEFHQFQPPPVDRVVNPIACGDCFAAGLAWALGQGDDIREAVHQGMASAAANLRTLLPSDFAGERERLSLR